MAFVYAGPHDPFLGVAGYGLSSGFVEAGYFEKEVFSR
jgi:hypothetical protein